MKIKTALLSYGMSGSVFHAPFIHVHEGYELYAVWERSKKTAKERYTSVISYDTYDELLADDNIELIVVNTPNATHYDFTKKALEAGKHVIVEKPFTVTSKEGEELAALAEKQDKVLSVYHNRRYDSDFKTIKKVLDENLLGDVVEAEFHYDRYRLELSPKHHKEKAGEGTGALYDLGSHLIDQALQLFGSPEKIFADVNTVRPSSSVDDFFELLFYYPDKRVRLRCSYIVREAVPATILHGKKGSFLKHRGDVQETMLQEGRMPGGPEWGVEQEKTIGCLHTEKRDIVIRKPFYSEKGNYMEYYDGMYEAIRNGKPAPVSAKEAIDVIRVIEAAVGSDRKGCVVMYDV